MTQPIKLPTYPARPVNGGPLEKAQPKRGEWLAEPKVNGWRALVHVPTGQMWNRQGEKLSIAGEFTAALDELSRKLTVEWADCEALERRHNLGRGSLIILDVVTSDPYGKRRAYLEEILPVRLSPRTFDPDRLYLIPSYPADQATDLYALLQTLNREAGCDFYEGVVMKRITALYPRQLISPSRETTDWVKHRWHF